jgi:hypothetical protein
MKRILKKIEPFFRRTIKVVETPIYIWGTDAAELLDSKGSNGIKSAKDFTYDNLPEVLAPSTVIISGGYGIWEFEISKYILKKLFDITLTIETIRTHGMLHTPIRNKSASIFVNNKLVDKIYLVKPHPHGEDYGVDSRRPFPIFHFIDKSKIKQTIKIEVDEDVFWDIDRITLHPIINLKELKPWCYMVLGAFISAVMGIIMSLIIF